MGDKIIFKMDGLDAMIKSLGEKGKKLEKNVAEEVNASALNVQKKAIRNAPVNFGTLRQSIQLTSAFKDKKLVYTIGSNLSYAP